MWRAGAGPWIGLLLLFVLASAGLAWSAPATPPAAVCLDAGAPEVLAVPLLPVEVRVAGQLVGVLIVKQVGGQLLVRADDLRDTNLDLPTGCMSGQFVVVPAELGPQLDTTTLVLQLGRQALKVPVSAPDAPTADSPQTTGTLLSASASAVAVSGEVSGTLSADTDTRLKVQSETASGAGDVQALGVRSDSTFGVHLTDGQAQTQASVSGAYLYWQRGLQEADIGLLSGSVQSDLGLQSGTSLLGVALHQGSAADAGAPLRLESVAGGSYRVLYRGVVLRQGLLTPGVTVVSDLLYPPVQDELTVELSDTAGTLLRTYTVPFDRRPQARAPGTLEYTLDAGLRQGQPSAGLSGTLALTPVSSVQAGVLLGTQRGLHAGLQLNSSDLTLSADAALLGSTDAVQGDTRRGRVSLGLSRAQNWGSWVVRGSSESARATSVAGAEVGRSTLLGLQAALFLTRPALQVQARIESLDTAAQPSAMQTSTVRGELSVAGSLHLDRPPRSPDGTSASKVTADWSVRLYATQQRQVGGVAVNQGGVNIGLNLRMLDDRPDLLVQGGVQGGLPQLAVQQTTQQDDLNLQRTFQVLPTPAIGLSVSGPYTASFGLVSGPSPVLSAALAGTVALTGPDSPPRLVPGSTRQALLVKVGVPGVQVRSNGEAATTDASGQAFLPIYASVPQSDVQVLLDSLPLSSSLSVLTLTVQPSPGALITVADFTPYLLRTNLRQLPASVPSGAVARRGKESFTVPESRYVQFDARNGDRVAVSWPTGSCTAVWSDQEVLSCQSDPRP